MDLIAGKDNQEIKDIPWVFEIVLRLFSFCQYFDPGFYDENQKNESIKERKEKGMFLGKFFIGLNPYHHRSEQDGKDDESFKKTMFCDFGKLIVQDKRKVLGIGSRL